MAFLRSLHYTLGTRQQMPQEADMDTGPKALRNGKAIRLTAYARCAG